MANDVCFQLPRTTRSVDVDVMGNGRVYLQFAYQYYVSEDSQPITVTTQPIESNSRPVTNKPNLTMHMEIPQTSPLPASPSSSPTKLVFSHSPPENLRPPQASIVEHQYFIIKPKARMSSTIAMTLDICYTYQPLTEEQKLTNMVILQVQFPSGFTANGESIENLRDEEHISRIDIRNSATTVEIYFERLEANDEQCLSIVGDKGHDVASLKPSLIEMYDFYNDKRRSRSLYELLKGD